MRVLASWVWHHKIGSLCLLVLLFVALEVGTLPFVEIAVLRTVNPQRTAMMDDRIAEAKADGHAYKIRQKWVRLGSISPDLIHATITGEDGMFYQHSGIDWYEVQKSMEINWEEGEIVRGASTITQQLAKNLFLSSSRNPLRKLREVLITYLLEWQLSKNRILELYLNIAEWGDGIFGAEMASRTYFGIPARSLSREQAARLAAVLPSPIRHRPNSDQRFVVRRAAIILRRMNARSY
jgi:monofunctional biosynthetic peptidoglycan transglycosylase